MAGKVNSYIVFDFETGGLDGTKNACTEIGLVCLDGETLEEVGRYESYIQPYIAEYDQAALDFTGITMEKLHLSGKPITQVGKEVFEWIKEMRVKTGTTSFTKKCILVGHNVLFDICFLKQLSKESKTDILSQVDCNKNDPSVPLYLDSIILAKMSWGDDEMMANFKLESCVGKIGSELSDGHKAINDVVGTKDLLIWCVKKLRSANEDGVSQAKIRVRDRVHFQF